MLDYWTLPGPSSFIAAVLSDVESGRNCVLLLPRREPAELIVKLRRALYDRWTIGRLSATPNKTPTEAIYECLLGSVPEDFAQNCAGLAADERLIGSLVLIEEVHEKCWPAWKGFLAEYERACRQMPADRRMLLIVKLKGTSALDPPSSEVSLAVFRWDGWLAEIDMLVYAAAMLRAFPLSPRKRQLIAMCLARMAVWDIEVIDYFCDGDPEAVLDPLDALRRLGETSGWSYVKEPSWDDGSAHEVEGALCVHSAYLAHHEPEAIRRRLWSAQAGVLLPLIEMQRMALLPKIRRYVKVPVETKTGMVSRLEDLEIGQMLWQLRESGGEQSLIRSVERLKMARDALAHLNPLAKEAATHSDLIG